MDSVIVAVILLGLCQCLAFACGCLFLRHVLNAKQAELEARAERALREWTEIGENNTPSKLATLVDTMGAVVGSAAARSIMASLNADASHAARAANGAADELEGQANPIMGLLTGSKRGKGAAVMRLASMLGPMLNGGASGSAGGNNGKTRSVQDRIKGG